MARQMTDTITTLEHLNAQPHLTLVLRHYTSPSGRKHHEVWERRNNTWHCLAAPLNPPGHTTGTPHLPVQLIWTPEPHPLCYLGQPPGKLGECIHDHTYNGDDE
jgi:hypothetical protein